MAENRTDEREDPARGEWGTAERDTTDAQHGGYAEGDPSATTTQTRTEAVTDPPEGESPSPMHDAGPAVAQASSGAGVPASAAAEHERLVAERAARREARMAALAPKPAPDPVAYPPRAASGPESADQPVEQVVRTETVTVTRRSTDKFAGSLGLFVLRLAVAAIVGVHGLNKLLNLPATTQMLQNTILPEPGILAIAIGAAEVAIAIALVFGLLTRVAGLGVVLVSAGALAFVLWGPWSPFQAGQSGFIGELEVLLVAVGLLFLLVGGGGWSVDRAFRGRRDSDTAATA